MLNMDLMRWCAENQLMDMLHGNHYHLNRNSLYKIIRKIMSGKYSFVCSFALFTETEIILIVFTHSGQPHRIFYNAPPQVNKIIAAPPVIRHTITSPNYFPTNLKYNRRADTVHKLIEPQHNGFRHI